MTDDVTFYSDGERIAGDLYLPPSRSGRGDASLPAVLVCPGWGGQKDRRSAALASRFALAGFIVLAFDYRGYGDSDGRADRLIPTEQVTDIRAGVAYLRTNDLVDPRRICVLGLLTGAAAALQAAAEDAVIAAVVALFPFGDGERWLRSLRGYWEWRVFVSRLDDDRTSRSRTGVSALVDSNDILIRGPSAPPARKHPLSLESADAIIAFKPETQLHRIAPRPVIVVGVQDDVMMPIDEVERLYARLTEPKRLIVVPGEHHELYDEPRITDVVTEVAGLLQEWVPQQP